MVAERREKRGAGGRAGNDPRQKTWGTPIPPEENQKDKKNERGKGIRKTGRSRMEWRRLTAYMCGALQNR